MYMHIMSEGTMKEKNTYCLKKNGLFTAVPENTCRNHSHLKNNL